MCQCRDGLARNNRATSGGGGPLKSSDVLAGLDAGSKAEILVEALPYIRRFWHKVVVVKYGGNALGRRLGVAGFRHRHRSYAFGRHAPVVVHGGGPQIGDLMERLGKKPEFREGLRVTDAETLDIARMVLVGKVNRDIVVRHQRPRPARRRRFRRRRRPDPGGTARPGARVS